MCRCADVCIHGAGGEAEAKAAYEEAYSAMFELQLDHDSHFQPYRDKIDSKSKWAKVEMWPITVSIPLYLACQCSPFYCASLACALQTSP